MERQNAKQYSGATSAVGGGRVAMDGVKNEVAPTTRLEAQALQQVRTLDDMRKDMQEKQAPRFSGPARTGQEREGTQVYVKPFLSTLENYEGHKARAQRNKHTSVNVPGRGGNPGVSSSTMFYEARETSLAEMLAPVTLVGPDFEGATDVDGEIPPDTHGAVGLQQFVEVTNSHVDIYDKADPTNRTSISQAAFFGYFTQGLFDARAVYDSIWNRWVITADAFPESSDVQYHFIAVSTTSSATDPFFIYAVNVTFNSGDFWDYPQLGMDQDAIIVTANIFDAASNYKGADMFAVAKAHLYNGLGFSVPVFTGLLGTLAPPIVLDQNANTFLVAAQPPGNVLKLYTLTNPSRVPGVTLSGPVDVPVDPYDVPPQAQQPGACGPLDTLDARFVNASTQIGNFLWNVHTINVGGLPTPRYYQIDASLNAVSQSGYFFASGSSNDFNASIAANSDNDAFVTWSSTDPAAGTNAQVRFSGCDHNDGACSIGAGSAAATSPTCFNGGRWGDYSAVTVDPTNPREAWMVNEDIAESGDWSSHISAIGLS